MCVFGSQGNAYSLFTKVKTDARKNLFSFPKPPSHRIHHPSIFPLARIEHMFYNGLTRDFEHVFLRKGRGAMDYKKLIHEMLEQIDDDKLLRRIYLMLVVMLRG